MWQRIKLSTLSFNYLTDNDECYFYDYYFSYGFYKLNQNINNFKKEINSTPIEMQFKRNCQLLWIEV